MTNFHAVYGVASPVKNRPLVRRRIVALPSFFEPYTARAKNKQTKKSESWKRDAIKRRLSAACIDLSWNTKLLLAVNGSVPKALFLRLPLR